MVFLLPDAVTEAAQVASERTAIVCRKESLSYGQLEQRSNQLARTLVDQGVIRGDRVGIFLDKSIESAIALYGIMKAGAAYVPLDVSAPPARLDYVVKHCGIHHLVTAPNKRRGLVQLLASSNSPIECLIGAPAIEGIRARHVSWKDISLTSSSHIESGCLDQDLAYIMYTSGSTGEPKGIMHSHASGLSYAKWAHDVYSLRAEDRLTNHAPLHFDLSTFDFFAGALAGATTVIVGDEYLKLPASYSQLLADEKITTFFTVPYTLTQLLTRGALDHRALTALSRHVLAPRNSETPSSSPVATINSDDLRQKHRGGRKELFSGPADEARIARSRQFPAAAHAHTAAREARDAQTIDARRRVRAQLLLHQRLPAGCQG